MRQLLWGVVLGAALAACSPAFAISCGTETVVGRSLVHFEIVGQEAFTSSFEVYSQSEVMLGDTIVGRSLMTGETMVSQAMSAVGQEDIWSQSEIVLDNAIYSQAEVEPIESIVSRGFERGEIFTQKEYATEGQVFSQEPSCP